MSYASAPIVGKGYSPIQHRPGCNALPWEVCECNTLP